MTYAGLRRAWLVIAPLVLVGASIAAWRRLPRGLAGDAAVEWAVVGVGFILLLLHLLLNMAAWQCWLRAATPNAPWSLAWNSFAESLPGKYLPGGVWMVATRLGSLQAQGVPASTAVAAVAAEQVAALLSALLLVLGGGFALDAVRWQEAWWRPNLDAARPWLLAVALLPLAALLLPVARRFLAHWRQRVATELVLDARTIAAACLLTCVAQLPFALAYAGLMLGTFAAPAAALLAMAVAAMAGTVAGFLVFVAPGGLGVREGSAALTAVALGADGATATLGVVIARGLIVATELVAYAAFACARPRMPGPGQ